MGQSTMSKENLLSEVEVSKAICILAIPAIIGTMITAIYNLVDTAFIGMLKSTEALSAISIAVTNIVVAQYGDNVVAAFGVVLKIISLGQLIVLGYVQGFQPIASYSYGSKNMPRFFDTERIIKIE